MAIASTVNYYEIQIIPTTSPVDYIPNQKCNFIQATIHFFIETQIMYTLLNPCKIKTWWPKITYKKTCLSCKIIVAVRRGYNEYP